MARISTYSIDTLDSNDKLLGTDQNGLTRNYVVGPGEGVAGDDNSTTIINYITESDPKALAFVFHNSTFGGTGSIQPGTINVSNSSTTTAFDAVTTLKVSKFPFAATTQTNPNSAVEILSEYVGERIKWGSSDNPNIYGIYECISFAQDGSSNFYNMGLAYLSGNGSFMAGNNSSTSGDIYILELFGTDKNYTHTQSSPAAQWTVNHNLNKFPSVVVKVGTAIMQAEINHTNQNSLTISFNGSNSGVAYMN
tara:strand:- start:138 stop:890 length:753 start_codon:yes stop_codon:yes gene_type:complete